MVFVQCSTYNQSQYIKQTLDGFCMQQTNFPFVCGIIDDASTDGEQEVLKRYLNEHFNLDDKKTYQREETVDYVRIYAQHKTNTNCFFLVVLLKTNHYQQHKDRMVYIDSWKQKAKYIAFCEGDDYWIDHHKLQIQVDYLESHSNCGMVHTLASVVEGSLCKVEDKTRGGDFTSFSELLLANRVVTLTTCLRGSVYMEFLRQYYTWPERNEWKMGDYPMWLWISKHSDVHFLNKVTGCYRVLAESASHTNDIQKTLAFLVSNYKVQSFFANKYNESEFVKNKIYNNYVKSRIHVLCQNRCYKEAFSDLTLLNWRYRFVYFTKIMMSILLR